MDKRHPFHTRAVPPYPPCGRERPTGLGVSACESEDYTFQFVATGDGPPVEIRVRRMLKATLRCYGLRATWAPATIGKLVVVSSGQKPEVGKRQKQGKGGDQ